MNKLFYGDNMGFLPNRQEGPPERETAVAAGSPRPPRRAALGVIGAFFDILIDWYSRSRAGRHRHCDMTAFLDLLQAGIGASR
jgi:hypothetical protein